MTISDEELARSLHQDELASIFQRRGPTQAPSVTASQGAAIPAPGPVGNAIASFVPDGVSAAPTVGMQPSTAVARRRTITIVIDGMNIMRSTGFVDPEFRDQAKADFLARRQQEGIGHQKAPMGLALVAAIDHCRNATAKALELGHGIEYKPMAFLPEWALDGGRSGNRAAFGAHVLRQYNDHGYLTLTPSYRDDDIPQIEHVKSQLVLGNECLLLTNDTFQDHCREERVDRQWVDRHVVSYMWLGRTNKLIFNFQDVHATTKYPLLSHADPSMSSA